MKVMRTKRIRLIIPAFVIYLFGATLTFAENGLKSLPALIVFFMIWYFLLSSGWNDVYLGKEYIKVKNYMKFWKRSQKLPISSILFFEFTEGSNFFYKLNIYLKSGERYSYAINHEIKLPLLKQALESQGLAHKNK